MDPEAEAKKKATDPSKQAASKETAEPPIPESAELHRRKAFGHTYWMLNSIEMFERLAYFGIRAVVPIYIMQATEPGGLHLTALHKGWIYMWWAILQSWLPMFTGGIADRYGYKRVLFYAISANSIGYLMMAYMHDYYGFFAGILVLATGTAFFKPALQGSIAQNLTRESSSMGWGIFYWVVNIGAMLAPIFATVVLGKPHSAEGWKNLFLVSAVYTACNLLLLLTFRDVPSGADKTQSLAKVFGITIENIWPYWLVGGRFHPARGIPGILLAMGGLFIVIVKPFEGLGDNQWKLGVGLLAAGLFLATWLRGGTFTWQLRLPAFLLIMSCFWMMMYQLWDLHPNFIEDWIDSAMVTSYVPFESWREYGDRGLLRVPQQILLTFYNAFLIILLIIPISYVVRKMRTLSAMLIGMGVATTGVLVAGFSSTGWFLLLGITFFSFGEMLTGPKKNQYLGLIAPPGKKGLYLGYVNIPIGVGVGLGSMIAGVVYDNYGEKAGLALKELAKRPALLARAARSVDWSDSLDRLPALLNIDRDQAFELAQTDLGLSAPDAADFLLAGFQFDQGQIENLALMYLATSDEYRERAANGLAEALREDASESEDRSELSQDGLDKLGVAQYVHLLPEAIGVKRPVAFELIRESVNRNAAPDAAKDDAEIINMLWERFAVDSHVLDNLSLEYLAQGTARVQDVVAGMAFEHGTDDLEGRIAEIEDRLGIGRTKSFAALCAALGADDAAVQEALDELEAPTGLWYERVYTYLIELPHHRFVSVARKDWKTDRALLRELVRSDESALQTAIAEIDQDTLTETLLKTIKRVFESEQDAGEVTPEGINYHRLSEKQDLIVKALQAKDWTGSPREAAMLLGLNPFEARAMAAAEVSQSPVSTTRFLWDEYYPQYKVWIPFASIGVVAMIALGIFGQMAKKWKDMNA
ncbi:MAG: MFS transporter [Phycisphaerales bacterium]|nr:MAG: MFS transporter [Phycisphaerales bacterium]